MHMKYQNMVDISHFSNINLRYDGWDTFTSLIESSKEKKVEEKVNGQSCLKGKQENKVLYKYSNRDISYSYGDHFSHKIKLIHCKIKPYRCLLCEGSFLDKSEKINSEYIKTVRCKSKSYKCLQCDISFSHRLFLSRHLRSYHMELKPLKCVLCDRTFIDGNSLSDHIKFVHEKYFESGKDLMMRNNTINEKLKSCNSFASDKVRCESPQKDDYCLNLHKIKPNNDLIGVSNISGNAKNSRSKPLCGKLEHCACSLCNNLTGKCKLSKNDAAVHICSLCNTSFRHERLLSRHLSTVHNKKKHECQICKRSFILRSSLSKHIKSNHRKLKRCDVKINLVEQIKLSPKKSKSYNCSMCKGAFNFKSHLLHHVSAVHLKLKPYKCSFCPISFSHKVHLSRHIAAGHKNKNHNCLICKKSFISEHTLAKHIKSVHDNLKNNNAKSDKKKHAKSVHDNLKHNNAKSDKKKHAKSVHEQLKHFDVKSNSKKCNEASHEGLKHYECSLCVSSFRDELQLFNHVFLVHNIQSYKCLTCGITFASKAKLSFHIKKSHKVFKHFKSFKFPKIVDDKSMFSYRDILFDCDK